MEKTHTSSFPFYLGWFRCLQRTDVTRQQHVLARTKGELITLRTPMLILFFSRHSSDQAMDTSTVSPSLVPCALNPPILFAFENSMTITLTKRLIIYRLPVQLELRPYRWRTSFHNRQTRIQDRRCHALTSAISNRSILFDRAERVG